MTGRPSPGAPWARLLSVAVVLVAATAFGITGSAHAAFPGVNGRIAYEGIGGIKTSFVDGSGRSDLGSRRIHPAWSPDGRKIAYMGVHDWETDGWDIYTMNADGTGVTRVTTGAASDEAPSWSRDGNSLVFRRWVDNDIRLYVVNADGSNERRLPVSVEWPGDPVWSPVADQIAFRHTGGIDVIDSDGTDQRTVLRKYDHDETYWEFVLRPDWSPDGSRLVFQVGGDSRGETNGEPYTTDSEIGMVNADGSQFRMLSNDSLPNAYPVWSPDGSRILYLGGFSLLDNQEERFHLVNPDGSGHTVLSFGGRGPSWGRDIDTDGDGVLDFPDNCRTVANADQADLDGDGKGDACDEDRDGDGKANGGDNCADVANPDQADLDGDGKGDACDTDRDGDGVANDDDNCADRANPDQADADGDGMGDVCDADRDGDGVPDSSDNCPADANAGQGDADADGRGDACDGDRDGDGVDNGPDNCPDVPNAEQGDWDRDGQGDACDTDRPPAQRTADLVEDIRSAPVHEGTKKSLTSKLEAAVAAYNANRLNEACAKLDSFLHEVRAQSGKKLTVAQATELAEEVEAIKADMGC